MRSHWRGWHSWAMTVYSISDVRVSCLFQCVCDWFEGHCEEPLARLALMGYDSIFYALDHAQDVAGGETTVDNLHQYLVGTSL